LRLARLAVSAVKRRRRPIGGATRETIFGGFAVMIGRGCRLDERGAIVEAIRIDDRAHPQRRLADRADINTATLTDQKLGRGGAER
jgi:hypothetical protein